MNYFTMKDLEALVDNELPPEKEKALMEFVARSPDLQKKYRQLVKQKELLKMWWASTKHS